MKWTSDTYLLIYFYKLWNIHFSHIRCFKQEQMAFCVRYPKGLQVCERFLGFIDVSEKQDAESLSREILDFIGRGNLREVPIIAQSYDGAAVMSGQKSGVQARIQANYPKAIFTHCMAHRLNLVVVDVCKLVKVSRSF